jgi:hypothetical protein
MDEIERIARTFQRHHKYYQGVGGETLQQQLSAERAIRLQYAGRATFELLQNALDRCERLCLVALVSVEHGALLIVGNDGPAVSVDPEFDYTSPRAPGVAAQRSDFHALCSMHTSNKLPDESIGNKGVGFRAVFSLGEYVQVWTRAGASPAWWGIELHRLLDRRRLEARRNDARFTAGSMRFLETPLALTDDTPRPSFYFPLPLWSDEEPVPLGDVAIDAKVLSTVVAVTLEPPALPQVEQAIAELRDSHVQFVGLRPHRRDVSVQILNGNTHEVRHTWFQVAGHDRLAVIAAWRARQGADGTPHAVAVLAEAAEHAVTEPSVAVGWPSTRDVQSSDGRYFCYLPTLVTQPFGIDVHADFQLGIDRTTLKHTPADPVGKYNRTLLAVGAEVHLHLTLRAAGFDDVGMADFARWRWVQPGELEISGTVPVRPHWLFRALCPSATDPFVEAIEGLLFDSGQSKESDGRYTRWAALAACFFAHGSQFPRATYDEFWEATAAWIDRACSYGRHTRTWGHVAKAVGDALRNSGARVVPILDEPVGIDDPVAHAEPLPDYIEARAGAGRAARRLFVRHVGDRQTGAGMHLPRALLDRRRAVTTYALPSGIDVEDGRALGAVPFERWDLLRELRQLPLDLSTWTSEPLHPSEAVKRQHEILRFAAELFVARFGTRLSPQDDAQRYVPGWRAYRDSGPYTEDELRAGRAVATLFVPTTSDLWEPARQVDRSRVSGEWLAQVAAAVVDLDVEAFVRFLGVSPTPLLVLDGGEAGRVAPQLTPPALIDVDAGAHVPLLRTIWGDEPDPEAILTRVRAAWPWLGPLLRAEKAGQLYGTLFGDLSSYDWFPARECTAPEGLVNATCGVAPRSIVLVGDPPDRRAPVLWRVRRLTRDADLLREIDAIPGLGDDDLSDSEAFRARRLWDHLTKLDLTTVCRDAKGRQALIDIFHALLLAVARTGSPSASALPLLTYEPADTELPFSERRLGWCAPEHDAWIAADNAARDRVRAFFPSVPLVVGTIGPQLIQRIGWLGARALVVTVDVRYRPFIGPEEEQFGPRVRQELGRLLPGLLALAEVSRLLPETVHPVDAAEKWNATSLEQADNVWVDLTLRLPGRPEAARKWLADTREDVLLDGDSIRFDVRTENHRPPPLRAFADALADAVVGNPVIAGVWSQALAAFEDGVREGHGHTAFREHIAKRGAQRLEDAYARMLNPLSAAAQRALWDKTDRALAPLGSGLVDAAVLDNLRELRPDALRTPPGGWGSYTEQDLAKQLEEVDWTAEERAFRPRVACRAYHAARWEAWIGHDRRLDRIVRFASELEAQDFGAPVGPPEELEKGLGEAVNAAMGRLAFDPAAFVREWLCERAPESTALRLPTDDEAALLAALPPLPAAFKPVQRLIDGVDAGCQRRGLALRGPVDAEFGVRTAEALAEENIARAESGRDAEDAFAEWVVGTTRSVLEQYGDAAWSVLFGALRPTARKARQRLERARREPQTLGEALHVAGYWGSAGYDFLGLETGSGAPLAVRYECKAARRATDSLRVYVSANELAVFRRTHGALHEDRLPGTWKLVAVEPDGRALDLTAFLDPLLDDVEGPLGRLATMGFTTDALILTVERR